jgi:hypothetical protein
VITFNESKYKKRKEPTTGNLSRRFRKLVAVPSGRCRSKKATPQSTSFRRTRWRGEKPSGSGLQRGYSRRRCQRVGDAGRRRAEGKKCERAEIRRGQSGRLGGLIGALVGSVSYLRTRLQT